jgi:hypothetical protein
VPDRTEEDNMKPPPSTARHGLGRAASVAVAIVIAAVGLDAHADEGRGWAAEARLGFSGLALDAVTELDQHLQLRAGASGMDSSQDGVPLGGTDYDTDVKAWTVNVLVDWYPWAKGWRFTAGLFWADLDLTGVANLEGDAEVEIGDGIYAGEDVGQLALSIDRSGLAPYVGVGWGNPFTSTSRWRFQADVGVLYEERVRVELEASGSNGDPAFEHDLTTEARGICNDFGHWSPYLALGVSLRF